MRKRLDDIQIGVQLTRGFTLEALILYSHDLLQRGQSAAEVFAMLFAKQRKGLATS